MKISIFLSHKKLRAAAIFASSDKTRYILNCVCLHIKAGGKPNLATIVATDGRRICAIDSTLDSGIQSDCTEIEKDIQVLIPLRLITGLIPGKKDPYWIDIETKDDAGDFFKSQQYLLTARTVDCSFGIKSIEGNYPNYIQALPANPTPSDGPLCVNPRFMADVCKAAELVGLKTPCVQLLNTKAYDGSQSIILAKVIGCPDFHAGVMPVRNEETLSFERPLFVAPKTVHPLTVPVEVKS